MTTQILTPPLLTPPRFVSAKRLQQSIVSAPEKAILLRLAKLTPCWINSDHLTLLGFLAQCAAGFCYALARWHRSALLLGILFIALNWLGDSLDGTLARFRKRERPRYGFYVDHITDTIAAFFLMGGLAFSGFVHPAIAFGLLISFLMLSIEAYLADVHPRSIPPVLLEVWPDRNQNSSFSRKSGSAQSSRGETIRHGVSVV